MPEVQSDISPKMWYHFYKRKLKLIKFDMMVYCFIERNITNTQKENKASLPQENQYHCLFNISSEFVVLAKI